MQTGGDLPALRATSCQISPPRRRGASVVLLPASQRIYRRAAGITDRQHWRITQRPCGFDGAPRRPARASARPCHPASSSSGIRPSSPAQRAARQRAVVGTAGQRCCNICNYAATRISDILTMFIRSRQPYQRAHDSFFPGAGDTCTKLSRRASSSSARRHHHQYRRVDVVASAFFHIRPSWCAPGL